MSAENGGGNVRRGNCPGEDDRGKMSGSNVRRLVGDAWLE